MLKRELERAVVARIMSIVPTECNHAIELIKPSLKHIRPDIRRAAVTALGRTGHPYAMGLLERVTQIEKDASVLKEAKSWLKKSARESEALA